MKYISKLFSTFTLIGSFCFSCAFAQQKKPNIIFILTDDQGYGDIGAFFQNQRAKANDRSKPFEISPNIDKLAASGAMLMQDYSSAPVCAPSRASILLGVSQGHANVRNNQFDKALSDNYTMASTLRTLGYSTIIVGKYGLQGDPEFDKDGASWPAKPMNRGFDHFFGYMRHMDGHEHYPKEGLYNGHKQVEVWDDGQNITSALDKVYTADLWTAYAKKWITDHENGKEKEKPFFMYLAYETPHAVLELPTQQYPKGGGLHGGLQWIGQKGHMINTADGQPDSYIEPLYENGTYDDDNNPATPEKPWPDTYKRYATANKRIDDGVGDLMQLLKDLKIDNNTLIVYTSDNGPSIESYLPKGYVPNHPTFFGSYGPFDGIKRDTWEGGMRMPTIAVWPGHIAPGSRIELPTISYDWATTFTNVAGMPAPAEMDGVSLLPGLTQKGTQLIKPIYTEYYESGRTPDFKDFAPSHRNRKRNQMQWIRIDNYVGVRYDIQSENDPFEIYDVVKDPGQRYNLADSKEMVSIKTAGVKTQISFTQFQELMKNKTLQMRIPNLTAKRPYDSTLIPSLSMNKTLTSGVHWCFYKGDFPWLPQIDGIPIFKQGNQASILFPKAIENKTSIPKGVVYLIGYLKIPKDGYYTFYLHPSTRTLIKLHDATIIDADKMFVAGKQYQVSIPLKAGLHPYRIYTFADTDNETGEVIKDDFIDLKWSGPSLDKTTIAPEYLLQDKL